MKHGKGASLVAKGASLLDVFGLFTINRKLEALMSQVDDLKTTLGEVKASQEQQATSLADLSNDVDKLLSLVQQQPPPDDLTEVIALATDIRDRSAALATAAQDASAKYDSSGN